MTKKRKLNKKEAKSHVDTDESGSGDKVKCLCFGESFGASVSGEGWACCTACKQWAHDECAGIDDSNVSFTCELCK